jgi:hypothetical protein
MRLFSIAACAAAVLAAGCSSRTVVVSPSPSASRSGNTAVTLGVPPGHLPPPGLCRVWVPGRPPGRQARARSCNGIAGTAPAGAWILYRPSSDRNVVQVRYVHEKRRGVVIRVRAFDVATGRYLREGP